MQTETTTPAPRDERSDYEQWRFSAEGICAMSSLGNFAAWQARAALAESELAEVRALSVTNIMLAVVPGADGLGEEVYAKSIDDVLQAFTKVEDRADKFQAECEELATEVADRLRRTLALQKERDELRAELERVKAGNKPAVGYFSPDAGNPHLCKTCGAFSAYHKFSRCPESVNVAHSDRSKDAARGVDG